MSRFDNAMKASRVLATDTGVNTQYSVRWPERDAVESCYLEPKLKQIVNHLWNQPSFQPVVREFGSELFHTTNLKRSSLPSSNRQRRSAMIGYDDGDLA